MATTRVRPGRAARAFARAFLYRLLAEGVSYPTADGIELLRRPYLDAVRAGSVTRGARAEDALAALGRTLSSLDLAAAESAYAMTFGHAGISHAVPYEAPYLTTNVFQETAALADVTGFYRAFGVEPSATRRERADHVALELEFMHLLTYKEGYALRNAGPDAAAVCAGAQRSFLAAHLGRWGSLFFRRLGEIAEATHYGPLAVLGETFLAAEAAWAGARPVPAGPPTADRAGAMTLPDGADASCPLEPGGAT